MRRRSSAINLEVMLGRTSQEVRPGGTSGEVMPTSSGSDARFAGKIFKPVYFAGQSPSVASRTSCGQFRLRRASKDH